MSPFQEGLYQLSPHGVIQTQYEDFGLDDTRPAAFGVAVVLTLLALAASRSSKAKRAVIRLALASALTSTALVMWTLARTYSLPSPDDYVEGLPVIAELLPVESVLDESYEDEVPVSTFVVRRSCKNDVCSLAAMRNNIAGCTLSPLIQSSGVLVLRADRNIGLWVFDGVSQDGLKARAQLPFRDSDLNCVWPDAAHLARSVRPANGYQLGAAVCCGLALALAWGSRRGRGAGRPALAIGVSLLSGVLLLPWVGVG
jgi:hypothetical protein